MLLHEALAATIGKDAFAVRGKHPDNVYCLDDVSSIQQYWNREGLLIHEEADILLDDLTADDWQVVWREDLR